MKKVKFKKIVALLCVASVMVTMFIPMVAASELSLNEQEELRQAQIDALLAEKAALVFDDAPESEIARIDAALAALGAYEITYAEVCELTDESIPYVEDPLETANVTWVRSDGTYIAGGTTYDVTCLTAYPTSGNSTTLCLSDATYISAFPDEQAALVEALGVFASGIGEIAIGEALAKIYTKAGRFIGVATTFHDALVTYVNGLQTTTTVHNVAASYLYQLQYFVKFYFFKPSGSSIFYESLSFITSMCSGSIQISIPNATLSNNGYGLNFSYQNIEYDVEVKPSAYCDLDVAFAGYTGAGSQRALVNNLVISGMDGGLVASITGPMPNHTSDLY